MHAMLHALLPAVGLSPGSRSGKPAGVERAAARYVLP
jgi:hypothetical protein